MGHQYRLSNFWWKVNEKGKYIDILTKNCEGELENNNNCLKTLLLVNNKKYRLVYICK